MKLTKTNRIKELLTENSALEAKRVAQIVGCDLSLVHMTKREMNKPKRGRPRKVVTVINPSVSLIDATKAMQSLVRGIKDFGIAFDYAREDLDVIWRDEVYQIAPEDLDKTIDCIKYLNSKELQYFHVEELDHDNA
jgi:hypothetical protein